MLNKIPRVYKGTRRANQKLQVNCPTTNTTKSLISGYVRSVMHVYDLLDITCIENHWQKLWSSLHPICNLIYTIIDSIITHVELKWCFNVSFHSHTAHYNHIWKVFTNTCMHGQLHIYNHTYSDIYYVYMRVGNNVRLTAVGVQQFLMAVT